MKDVILKGTGRKAYIPGLELAGKTGTTDNGKDAWFNVFSPEVQLHVWYGKDDNTPIFNNGIASSALAVPVGKYFFQKLMELGKYFERKFHIPEGVQRYKFNGVMENFTDISKPPPITEDSIDDVLMF
jgi:penicillin-binding protein 1A